MQVNKLLRYSMLAVYVGAGAGLAAHADPQLQMDNRDPSFNAGPVKITFGGFTALETIYRKHNEDADVGSSFYKIPFPGYSSNYSLPGSYTGSGTSIAATAGNPQEYYEPEFRESARQSRFGFLAQYASGPDKLEYYMETDFLSAGTTSNSNESNSYTLRMRHFYGDWQHDDWSLLAGQTWSLAVPFTSGMAIRKQASPLTIDAQYVVGFNWARQAQLRLVKNFGQMAAVGISLEAPQTAGILGSAGSGTTVNSPGSGSGLLNPATSYSDDIAPDVVVKFETEPGFGHYEVYSLTRFMHDRGNGTLETSQQNHTTIAASVGASALIPVVPKLVDFQASGLVGRGNGRYGSGQLNDAVLNPTNGALSATQEQQMLFGLVGHPTYRLDTYVYAGMENQKAAYGDGGGAGKNAGCDENPIGHEPTSGTPPVTSPITTNLACTGIIGNERMVAFGGWWKAYKGALGSFQIGAEGSYLVNHTFADASGHVGTTRDGMGFLSFRYYPFQ
jgi:hypothetical protein